MILNLINFIFAPKVEISSYYPSFQKLFLPEDQFLTNVQLSLLSVDYYDIWLCLRTEKYCQKFNEVRKFFNKQTIK
ncbi:hypothetical protein GCM10023115_37160 [Pontixanthobacter gangjinensis]